MTKPNPREWERRFSQQFTDDILPNGWGNDLRLTKEDGDSLMEFIQQERQLLIEWVEREIENLPFEAEVGMWNEDKAIGFQAAKDKIRAKLNEVKEEK